MKSIFFLVLSGLTLGTLLAWNVMAGDGYGCCAHCGCNNLVPVCRLVPVTTKVPKVEYSCKCGDICVPGRSICCGKECVTDCDGNCHQAKVYEPTCGKVYPTVTLVKTTKMVEKCTYKCVVEYVCDKCGCNCGSGTGCATPGHAPATIPTHAESHPLHRQSN